MSAAESIAAVLDAMQRVAERHRLSYLHHIDPVRTIEDQGDGPVVRHIVGDLSLPSAVVRAFVDGEVALYLRPDADVDILRAALVARDLHRSCGRMLALVAGDPATTDAGGPS